VKLGDVLLILCPNFELGHGCCLLHELGSSGEDAAETRAGGGDVVVRHRLGWKSSVEEMRCNLQEKHHSPAVSQAPVLDDPDGSRPGTPRHLPT